MSSSNAGCLPSALRQPGPGVTCGGGVAVGREVGEAVCVGLSSLSPPVHPVTVNIKPRSTANRMRVG